MFIRSTERGAAPPLLIGSINPSSTLRFALNFPARQGIFRAIVRYIGRKILWRAGKFKAKQRVSCPSPALRPVSGESTRTLLKAGFDCMRTDNDDQSYLLLSWARVTLKDLTTLAALTHLKLSYMALCQNILPNGSIGWICPSIFPTLSNTRKLLFPFS